MFMLKKIIHGLLGILALVAVPAVAAESSTVRSVLERVELVPLSPGSAWHVDASEADDLAVHGCAFGPNGAFKGALAEGESPCAKAAIKAKKKAVNAGGFVYDIRRMGSTFVYTMTDQGMSRNPNFRCTFMVLSNGQVTDNNCVNTPNGKMMFDAVLGAAVSQTVPAVLGTLTANITAPKSGNTNINVGADSASGSNSSANSHSTGGGAAGPITFNVSATGGQGGAAGASSNSAANLTGGCTTCGQTANPTPH